MSEPNVSRDIITRETVYKRLEALATQKSINPLKDLFWTDLAYNRVNQPLSYRTWSESIKNTLYKDDPIILLADGGKDNDFKIIYIRLAQNLRSSAERPIVMKLLDQYLDALVKYPKT